MLTMCIHKWIKLDRNVYSLYRNHNSSRTLEGALSPTPVMSRELSLRRLFPVASYLRGVSGLKKKESIVHINRWTALF